MLAAVLLTALQEPTRAWVRDALTGAPIAGVECELWSEDFDAPARLADRALTEADGAFVLTPRTREDEKVRLRAPGYRALVDSSLEESYVLFPCEEPLRLRVLDLDGKPIAGARVRSHQTCRHAPPAVEGTSDAEGLVLLPAAPAFGQGAEYEVRASGFGAWIGTPVDASAGEPALYLPRRAAVPLCLVGADGAPLAHRRFRQQGPLPTIVITGGDGRAVLDSLFESRELGLTDCAQELPYMGGWPPLEGECTLHPGQDLPRPAGSEAWPTLRLTGKTWGDVHVQFGNDSLTLGGLSGERTVRVAPGRTVVVLAQAEEVRRSELAPWTGERALDLADLAVLRARPPAGTPVDVAFRVRDAAGEPLAAEAEWRAPYQGDGPPEDRDPSPDGVLVRIPEGARYALRFAAERHVSVFRTGRARAGAEPGEVRLPPAR